MSGHLIRFAISAILPLGLCGCPAVGPVEVGADDAAISVVVQDVFSRVNESNVVYLAGAAGDADALARARVQLAGVLPAQLRAADERIFGEAGAGIALGRFRAGTDGRVSVVATFVSPAGDDRGCITYTMEPRGGEWHIVDRTEEPNGCGAGEQRIPTFDAALHQVEGNACGLLGAAKGACGPWLVLISWTGYTVIESYFDPATGLQVAERWKDDIGGDFFPFGTVDCEVTGREPIALAEPCP